MARFALFFISLGVKSGVKSCQVVISLGVNSVLSPAR